MKVEKLFRSFEIRKNDVDEKNRTVSLSFSSEEPVERWFGYEVLDHNPRSVRLDRLKRSAPLLWNHNPNEQIGVVEGVSISRGRGSAVVRFGKSARADEIFNDVVGEIVRNTSVGYRIFEMALEKKEGDLEHYRITDWEPLEVSLVSIPADTSVGVNRQDEKKYEVRILEEEDYKMKDIEKAVEDARKEELFRAKEIRATGVRCKMEAEAEEAIGRGDSVEDFRKVAFEKISTKTGPITTDVRDLQAEKPFRTFGEQLQAVRMAASPGGQTDKRLSYLNRAASGMGEQIPSEGGFLVQSDFSLALLEKTGETGILPKKCLRLPISGNSNGIDLPLVDEISRATGSRWGGIQIYWACEGDTVTTKKPKLGKLELKLNKLMGVCYASDELLQDTNALGFVITNGFSEEMGFIIDDCIIRGPGAGRPLGILNSPALVSVAKEAGQTAATIVLENLVKMYSRMPARNRKNAIWLINQEIEPQLFTLGLMLGTGGAPVYLPSGGISGEPYGTLFGRPIIPMEQASALGIVGDIIFFDPQSYVLIEKGGVVGDMSIHVRFIYDEQTFRFIYRVDGAPIWKQPLTAYKGTATLSPYVALATRA